MLEDEIYQTTNENPEFLKDLEGVSVKAFPNLPKKIAIYLTSLWISKYEQMWHMANNQDPYRQNKKFKGEPTFYLDEEHEIKNKNIPSSVYLKVFKEFTKIWAAREKSGNSEKDWNLAQYGISKLVRMKIIKDYFS